jgi:hypothetical protein
MVAIAAVAAAGISAGVGALSASKQASAAKSAAKTQAQSADAALALEREQWEQSRADLEPWRVAGLSALGGLQQLVQQPLQAPGPFTGPQPVDPAQYRFTAPTAADLSRDPGYQFRLAEGRRLLEGGAAARGLLQSGGTLRGLTELGQNLASQEYQNVYNRQLGENQLGYTRAIAQNQDQYNRALQSYDLAARVPLQYRQQAYNELAGLSGTGQTTAQNLGTLGVNYGRTAADLLTSQGAAQAAGTIGSANAWSAGLQGIGTAANQGLSNYLLYQHLQRQPQQPQYGVLPSAHPYGGGVNF